jgi:hypothetical protein
MTGRKEPAIWRCPHPYPIEVVGTANAKGQARPVPLLRGYRPGAEGLGRGRKGA